MSFHTPDLPSSFRANEKMGTLNLVLTFPKEARGIKCRVSRSSDLCVHGSFIKGIKGMAQGVSHSLVKDRVC